MQPNKFKKIIKCTVQWHLVHLQCCIVTLSGFKPFSSLPKEWPIKQSLSTFSLSPVCLLSLWICLFWMFHYTWNLSVCVRSFASATVHWGSLSIHIVTRINASILRLDNFPTIWRDHILFFYFSVDGHIGCFFLLLWIAIYQHLCPSIGQNVSRQEGLHHNHGGTLISDCQPPEWPLFINHPVYSMLLCSFNRLRHFCLSTYLHGLPLFSVSCFVLANIYSQRLLCSVAQSCLFPRSVSLLLTVALQGRWCYHQYLRT